MNLDAQKRQCDEEWARKLFRFLRRKPKPSFATFLDALLKVGGGADLYECLSGSSKKFPRRKPSSRTKLLSSRKRGRRCSKRKRQGIIRSHVAATLLVRDDLGSRLARTPSQLLTRQTPLSRSCETTVVHHDEEVTVFVDVTKELEKRYELHEDSFVTALKDYLRKAIPQRVRIVKHFPPTVRERNALRLEVAKFVQISILFPNIDRERFKQEEKDFVRYITRIMKIPESELELCIEDGSCIVTMTVPGHGFINMMRHLGDCGMLSVLFKIDAQALISFGTLPRAPIGNYFICVSLNCCYVAIGRLRPDVFTSIFNRIRGRNKSAECKRKVASAQWDLDSICVRPFPSVVQCIYTSYFSYANPVIL